MIKRSFLIAAATAAIAVASVLPAQARDQLRVVGSSTVYPFTTAVAEQFGKAGGKTPVVESTGTGGGMKIFCEGVGVKTPDATNASRRIKASEFAMCQKNGVKGIIELKVGYDGLTIAQSKAGSKIKLTPAQVFLALGEMVPGKDGKLVKNPNKMWSDIDKSLPAVKIEVLGPPPTSGTRDSFHELVLEAGAKKLGLKKSLDKNAFKKAWKSIRKDGAYVEAGENDNVIVQKLVANKNAFGIFGFSFLEENSAKLRGVAMNGTEPTFDTIASGKYPASRPLFIYFKKQHIGVVKGLEKFIAEYVSDKALGSEGYLSSKGLVPLPTKELAAVRGAIKAQKALTAADLAKK